MNKVNCTARAMKKAVYKLKAEYSVKTVSALKNRKHKGGVLCEDRVGAQEPQAQGRSAL